MHELSRGNIQDMAVATLTDVWSQIDWDKVDSKRSMGIWDEFTSKVKACALSTNKYETFVENICKQMGVRSLKWNNISNISDMEEEFKKAVLKMIRTETQLIVLKLRVNNQIRKEQAMQEKSRQEKQKELENKLNNTKVQFTEKGVDAHEN